MPIYILMLGAPGKVAIPLSNATILGGGLGNNIFTFNKRHPLRDSPLIDYDTVLMLEPLTIFGAVIGEAFFASPPRSQPATPPIRPSLPC